MVLCKLQEKRLTDSTRAKGFATATARFLSSFFNFYPLFLSTRGPSPSLSFLLLFPVVRRPISQSVSQRSRWTFFFEYVESFSDTSVRVEIKFERKLRSLMKFFDITIPESSTSFGCEIGNWRQIEKGIDDRPRVLPRPNGRFFKGYYPNSSSKVAAETKRPGWFAFNEHSVERASRYRV